MKRIITCSDGTWNKPGDKYDGEYVETNVQKIFEAICKRVRNERNEVIHQVKYYDEGIGAEGTAWSKMIDGATGKGIDDNIKDMYKFIVWNYEPGDELFLFGFSRGAYTARSLAGLIRNCGILKCNDLPLIDRAYEIYRDRVNDDLRPDGETARLFREKYSHPLKPIKFIGVWDTVGALGIPVHAFQWINKNRYEFHDTKLSSLIENAYQALAVDEHRDNFKPTLWQKSDAAKFGQVKQEMEQAWFPGVHSNIGGGYPKEGLSDVALDWMVKKAQKCGLGFDEPYLLHRIRPNSIAKMYDSKTGVFSFMPDYARPVMKTEHANELIDESVWERMHEFADYRPENIISRGLTESVS
jgi:uncharacterized protein (DUF2235 family)